MALHWSEVVAASPSMSSIAYLLFRLECLCVCVCVSWASILSLFRDGSRTMLDAHKANVRLESLLAASSFACWSLACSKRLTTNVAVFWRKGILQIVTYMNILEHVKFKQRMVFIWKNIIPERILQNRTILHSTWSKWKTSSIYPALVTFSQSSRMNRNCASAAGTCSFS